jgi:hypothetical protein
VSTAQIIAIVVLGTVFGGFVLLMAITKRYPAVKPPEAHGAEIRNPAVPRSTVKSAERRKPNETWANKKRGEVHEQQP